ncbi:MAG: DUF4870 domain-containing protein [bacterium]|nr:DUF4870 domain-containing protein [bacterium]
MHDSATYDEDPSIEAVDQDDRIWGAIAHLSTLLSLPFFNLLGPLIVMLAKGDESYFIRKQAVAALNFQITILIIYVILTITIIGLAVIWIVPIVSLIVTCLAGIKSFEGRSYNYPFSFHFVT